MEPKELVATLDGNLEVFTGLLKVGDQSLVTWKQSEEKWSLLQIICHLVNEEKEDFRARVACTLETPGQHPPKINPAAWVEDRKYADQDFGEKVNEFIQERKRSVKYLRSHLDSDWDSFYEHEIKGPLSAKFFLKNWVVHDLLHIKQIVRLKYDYLENTDNKPIDYAGKWT